MHGIGHLLLWCSLYEHKSIFHDKNLKQNQIQVTVLTFIILAIFIKDKVKQMITPDKI